MKSYNNIDLKCQYDYVDRGNFGKLLTSNRDGGILPLTDEKLTMLSKNHPEPADCNPDSIPYIQPVAVHTVIYDEITAESVRNAALNTHGDSGPSGMNTDGWRHIPISRMYSIG